MKDLLRLIIRKQIVMLLSSYQIGRPFRLNIAMS